MISLAYQEGKDKGDAAAAAGMSCGELAALCTAGWVIFSWWIDLPDGLLHCRLLEDIFSWWIYADGCG